MYAVGCSRPEHANLKGDHKKGINLPPPPDFLGLDIAGAWSAYGYNGFIYETNIGEGSNIFRLSDRAKAGAMCLDHLKPQTQEFTSL